MEPEEHRVLDTLFATGPMVLFWSDVFGDPDLPRHPNTLEQAYVSPSMEVVFGYRPDEINDPRFWMSQGQQGLNEGDALPVAGQ